MTARLERLVSLKVFRSAISGESFRQLRDAIQWIICQTDDIGPQPLVSYFDQDSLQFLKVWSQLLKYYLYHNTTKNNYWDILESSDSGTNTIILSRWQLHDWDLRKIANFSIVSFFILKFQILFCFFYLKQVSNAGEPRNIPNFPHTWNHQLSKISMSTYLYQVS